MGTTCPSVGRGCSGGALGDVSGLEAKEEVEKVAQWAAFALLRANLSESSDVECSGHGQDAPLSGARFS